MSNYTVMNVWDETIASRGAEDIAFCLVHYCCEKSDAGTEHITAFSDSCGARIEI